MSLRQLKNKDIPYYRDKILKEDQDNKCAICMKRPPKNPCLDHHHKKKIKGTGQIRGVLCSNCNIFLGKIENNAVRYGISHKDLPDILVAISNYLKKPQYDLIHPTETPAKKILKKSSYLKLKKVYVGRSKFPEYPKSGTLTKPLKRLYEKFGIIPEFYKSK